MAWEPATGMADPLESLSLLTTRRRQDGSGLLAWTGDTSAATAAAARMGILVSAEYPEFWPETLRALLVHSGRWTPVMAARFSDFTRRKQAERILLREDADAAEIVARAFTREGIELLTGCGIQDVRAEAGEKRLRVRCGDGGTREIAVDEILVGVGRAPNVEGLALERVGVAFGPEGVQVDDALRTTNPRIFAAGDVCMRWKFTHAADAAAKIVVRNALFPFLPKQKLSKGSGAARSKR